MHRVAGVKDVARIRRTIGATLQVTIGLIIVQLFTTCGLGGPTRQCLRENEQQKRGSSYPVPEWRIRSGFMMKDEDLLSFNSGAPEWVKTYGG